MVIENLVDGCFQKCPFFGNDSDGMCCNHPYWKDKGTYDNMIITQENSRDGNIPQLCPLLKSDLTILYRLENK
jgi:hypothetical protein